MSESIVNERQFIDQKKVSSEILKGPDGGTVVTQLDPHERVQGPGSWIQIWGVRTCQVCACVPMIHAGRGGLWHEDSVGEPPFSGKEGREEKSMYLHPSIQNEMKNPVNQ